MHAFLQPLILHTFNYTVVTYQYFSLHSWDKDHSPQIELAILDLYNNNINAQASLKLTKENSHKTGKKAKNKCDF